MPKWEFLAISPESWLIRSLNGCCWNWFDEIFDALNIFLSLFFYWHHLTVELILWLEKRRILKHLYLPNYAIILPNYAIILDTRELAIQIIGRLSKFNPAYIMPSLRKTLIQVRRGVHRNSKRGGRDWRGRDEYWQK